jgi:hypothetical protein
MESPLLFYARLAEQAQRFCQERYLAYLTELHADVPRPGRPRTLDNEPRRRKGAPSKPLPAQVAAAVAEQRRKIPAIARDVLLADLRTRDPQRYQQFQRALRDVQRNEDLSWEAALIRVFGEPLFRDERTQLESLIRSSRNHLKRSHFAKR